MGQVAAFFDFDGTIIEGDSYRKFLKYNLKQNFRTMVAFKILVSLIMRKLRIISLKRAKEQALSHLMIENMDNLKIISSKFAKEILEPLVLNEAQKKIKWHKEKAHVVVLVSSAPNIYFEFLKDKLDLDFILSSSVENRNGKYKITDHCFGSRKLEKMIEISFTEDIELPLSYAYSDHQSDLAMLEAVKYPCAVLPTKKLERYAEKVGWQILKWS